MTTATATTGADAKRRPIDEDEDLERRLWYADPTGEQAMRHLLADAGLAANDLRLVDANGKEIVLIKSHVFLAEVVPHLRFTPTRRGGKAVRAHKKNAPTQGAVTPGANAPSRGEDRNHSLHKKGIKS